MIPAIRYLIATLLGLLLCAEFFFLYSGRFDNVLYDESGVVVGVLLVLLGIPATIAAFARSAFASNEGLRLAGSLLGMFSIIINGPIFGYWSGWHEERCYEQYGAETWGMVTETLKGGTRMYYRFRADGVYYSSYNVTNPLRHAEGDSVLVVYNQKIPGMNSAAENTDLYEVDTVGAE